VTCHHCACKDEVQEKARVAALEQQNTDLIKIVGKLIEGRLDFRFILDPSLMQLKLDDYPKHMAHDAAKKAKIMIENMLEDRKQFFHDYYLLKMTATPQYYSEVMKNKL
jgi:hypothetical protein